MTLNDVSILFWALPGVVLAGICLAIAGRGNRLLWALLAAGLATCWYFVGSWAATLFDLTGGAAELSARQLVWLLIAVHQPAVLCISAYLLRRWRARHLA